MNRIKQLCTRIDELTLRERAIIFIAILVVLFLGWYSYFMDPLMKEEKRLLTQLSNKRGQLQTLNTQFENMTGKTRADKDAMNRQRIAQLKQQIADMGVELKTATASLVTPQDMPEILRLVLNKSRGLTLLKLTGLGGTPLLVKTQGTESKNGGRPGAVKDGLGGAYKHGMKIQFQGDFYETLDYIRALEGLRQGFFWDEINFEVKDYPDSVTTLTLYTLSLNPDWIRI